MPRAPSSGLGSTLETGTPHSSRRSVTSDYDTSSILDSASMYGGDEPSTPSPPVRSQVQRQREVYVGDDLPPRSNSTRRKSKEPSPSAALPTIVTTKAPNNTSPVRSTDKNRSLSVTGDDIEAAFDAISDYKTSLNEPSNNKTKEHEIASPDAYFGLSTIKEATDTEDIILGAGSSKQQQQQQQQNDEVADEIDFDNCFNKYKQPPKEQPQNQPKIVEEKKSKQTAPSIPIIQQPQQTPEPKSTRHSKEHKRPSPISINEIHTPSISIPTPNLEISPSPSFTIPTTQPKETPSNHLEDSNDSIDEDVDELLGKLEVSISLPSTYAHIHTHTYTHDY